MAAGDTATDGWLTLERLDCAFNCSVAPVVEVDGRCAGRVAGRDARRLLRGWPRPERPRGRAAGAAILP